MHSATEITRRKQIVQDFHELKSEIMSLLGMNPVQIEMLDTQSIIQGTGHCNNAVSFLETIYQAKSRWNEVIFREKRQFCKKNVLAERSGRLLR